MKHKFLFLILVNIVLTETVSAQMETWMLNQWLNQMNADTYRQQQQAADDIMKLFNQELERQKANEMVVCNILPEGTDRFFAYITAAYINLNNLEIIKVSGNGYETVLPASSYFALNGRIITSAVLSPGMSVIVKRKDTGKIMDQMSIPKKDSPNYHTFVQNGYAAAQIISGGNSSNGYSSGGAGNSKATGANSCSLCHGKGWIRGSSTPTYGTSGTHWCSECGDYVNASHSHDRCPSCSGRGYINK